MAARFTSLINAGFGLPQLSPVAFDLTGENKLPFVYTHLSFGHSRIASSERPSQAVCDAVAPTQTEIVR
jgi:hypothetical protein